MISNSLQRLSWGLLLFAHLFVSCSFEPSPQLTNLNHNNDHSDIEDAQEATCEDGVINGDETDIDCGGPDCDPCELEQSCEENSDCLSNYCEDALCRVDPSAPECSLTTPCPDGQICNRRQKCVPDDLGPPCVDHDDCRGDRFCDPATQACLPAVSCDDIECADDETCIEPYGTCRPDDARCGSISAADCSGAAPYFDQQSCACVACIISSHCPAGQLCRGASCQPDGGACATPCSANTPGTCGGSTPYCIDNCCVGCLGTADCPGGELCVEGYCGPAPSCDADPDACPAGYDCVSGVCRPPMDGEACDPQNPDSCGNPLLICDPQTGTCTGMGGDMGCGMCDEDCTCPNGLICDGSVCTGCETQGLDFSGGCPDGQLCLSGICMSF